MPDLQLPSWITWATSCLALLGAVLGVINTWHSINDRKVRLRVKPAFAFPTDGSRIMFSIEVVNISAFPVTVTEVGFSQKGKNIDRAGRFAVTRPVMIDGKSWPRRLGSREAVSCYFAPEELMDRGSRIGKAYARTSCGVTRYGESPALKQLRSTVRNLSVE